MKRTLGILQITLSLCGVFMCGTVTYAAINMATGQYQVEITVNNRGLNIKSDIDKRECKATDFEQKRLNE
ncbi:MAG: hypothetical protein MET45_24790 [Nostoc sp. LLA-1]|nr:hypothetical protein [Cyanocohniella sp. LLY]